MRNTVLVLGILGFAIGRLLAQPAQAPSPSPRLVVLLVVDQMRSDYVTRFQQDWTKGLKRIMREGAWYSNAAYPYHTTFTCAGHATIATGAFPRSHGVFQNEWFDRALGRSVTCTEERTQKNLGYFEGATGGDSAVNLKLPTLGDELRRQRGARVVTLALKARSAIMMAGQAGQAVTWFSTSRQGFETSSAFASGPVPSVTAFMHANPIERDFGKVWDRLLPIARYPTADAGEREAPPRGWTATFPHPLRADDPAVRDQWEMSPYADEYLARLAVALVDAEELGQRDATTDLLAVSFSSPDILGHAFGPQSQEIQDMYLRLDQTIGTLLDALDAKVGHGRYVVALGSDHGVADIPEQARSEGRDAGRLSTGRMTSIVDAAMQTAFGKGNYVARLSSNDLYFEPQMYEKLVGNPAVMSQVVNTILAQPGVASVFRREELADPSSLKDPRRRAAALSYVEGRSGDLRLAVKPGWMFRADGTTHGSPNLYDQQVPVIVMGPGVKAGTYREAVTPADIAPTLAALAGIQLPSAEGRVLSAVQPR
jgi:predicted AlkP superfamily pyrophosphatase or phosphodiesterase